jgi:AraC-like DNA-binding protein
MCIRDRRICDIYSESLNEHYAYELAVQGNIIMLFLEIVRSWHGLGIDINNDTINKRDVEWLRKAILFIEENYNQNISAKQVAELCAMSYNYFTARFKKVLGRSFSSHLNYVRLRQAEYKLVSTNDSITNVAYDSGFSSTSYFISIFAKHKGITPQNYRKRLRTKQ